jgi:hypothetical protein
MGAVYEVYLYSNAGAQLATLTKRLTRLEWNRIVNDQGSFAITLSDRLQPIDTSLFQLNSRVAIYRKPSPLDPAKLLMVGFIRGWDFETDGRGVTRYTWHGPDQNCLLADRTCLVMFNGFWDPGHWGYADHLMRHVAYINAGPGDSNGADRDIVSANGAGLTIAIEDENTATSCTTAGQMGFTWGGKNLLRSLQEINKASLTYKENGVGTAAVPIFFDLCTDSDTAFTFRTFANRRGMNHRSDSGQAVHIGARYGNLTQPRWQHDRTGEVNAVLKVFQPGNGGFVTDAFRIGEAPLNRREDAVILGDDGGGEPEARLNEGKPKPRFSGKIQDTPTCRFGLHWDLGDELTVDYLEKQYNCRVTGVAGTMYAGREILEPTMEVLET